MTFGKYVRLLDRADFVVSRGSVKRVVGLAVESNGPIVNIGEVCSIYPSRGGRPVHAEVVGFKNSEIMLMPFENLSGIGPGSVVESEMRPFSVPVGMSLVGRAVDGLGAPIDGLGPIDAEDYRGVDGKVSNPMDRPRVKEPLTLGVKVLDGLLTCGKGQRIGIFAGSGVGKSTLLGMIARNSGADVNVIALVGERGREVRDFIEKDLKKEGMARTVLVVATSDKPAMIRLKCALSATTIAEYFRDCGMNVMLMMDSLTRFAMAQREIGLAAGEPPVARGYTPSIFAVLPKLLERTGNFRTGSITGIYTVLVEGDDMNEPISDTVRGILDGHIVLSRDLAARNHYPAINVLSSISRLMPDIVTKEHREAANRIRELMATYAGYADLIELGAYKKGSNEEVDRAIRFKGPIDAFLKQQVGETFSLEQTVGMMEQTLAG